MYNLISEEILIEKLAKKKKNPADWLNIVNANKGLFQHTQYQSWRMYSESIIWTFLV